MDREQKDLGHGRNDRKLRNGDSGCNRTCGRHNELMLSPKKLISMEPKLLYGLAEAVLGFHVAVVPFNVFGLIVIPVGAWRGWAFVRVFWWRALHLAMLTIVAVQVVLGRVCFLTLWQSDLLQQAGETGSNVPMIQGWVTRVIFWPLPLWFFAILYVAVCGYALVLWWLVPPRRTRRSASR